MGKFEYTPPKNASVSSEELLNNLKKVASDNNTDILPQRLYKKYGKYDVTNISRRFGTWNKALLKSGLKPGNINNYSDEELFEDILNIWQYKCKQPVRRDLDLASSNISQHPYNRRFGSWSEALRCFVEYANENDNTLITSSESKDMVVYYFMSDNLVLKNLPNSKDYLESLLSLMESFYFYPAS